MNPEPHNEGRCRLAAEALVSWGKLKLRATGVSMLPTLWPGDVLTIQSHSPEQARAGEIVLYMRRGRFFIHRVVRKNLVRDELVVLTRGDCMSADDLPVGRGELLGKVVEVCRAGSVFSPAERLSLLGRFMAGAFCHWGLFRRAGLRLWKYRYSSDCPVEGTFL